MIKNDADSQAGTPDCQGVATVNFKGKSWCLAMPPVMRGVFMVLFAVQLAFTASAEDKPRVLTDKEAETFKNIVAKREMKRANFLVLERLLVEKRTLFKTLSETLDKEHQVSTDASFSYIADDKTLYRLSTNGVAKGKEPKKTVVKKFKNDDESLPLRKLMASRLQTENQLVALAVLSEENRQETLGWDALLRKTFNLEPDGRYQIKKLEKGGHELLKLPEEKNEKP